MRFEVPQFIEIEDKIFGPFTWKQFVYLCGGIGIAVVLFITTPFIVFLVLGIPLAGLAALLAFYPINNRPFSVFLEAVFNFYTNTTNYRWQRTQQAVYKAKQTTPAPTPDEDAPPQVPKDSNGINSLARKLELKAIQQEK